MDRNGEVLGGSRSLTAGCDLSLGMAEEIIDSLRPEVDISPWASWTEKEWDQVLR